MDGIVVRLLKDKGFGFIKEEITNIEYFFHRSAVKNIGFEEIEVSRKVSFDATEGTKGPRAENVYV